MNDPLLTHRQLFSMTPKNLEKRISEYYYKTQNSSLTIQYSRHTARSIRNALPGSRLDVSPTRISTPGVSRPEK